MGERSQLNLPETDTPQLSGRKASPPSSLHAAQYDPRTPLLGQSPDRRQQLQHAQGVPERLGRDRVWRLSPAVGIPERIKEKYSKKNWQKWYVDPSQYDAQSSIVYFDSGPSLGTCPFLSLKLDTRVMI